MEFKSKPGFGFSTFSFLEENSNVFNYDLESSDVSSCECNKTVSSSRKNVEEQTFVSVETEGQKLQ